MNSSLFDDECFTILARDESEYISLSRVIELLKWTSPYLPLHVWFPRNDESFSFQGLHELAVGKVRSRESLVKKFSFVVPLGDIPRSLLLG